MHTQSSTIDLVAGYRAYAEPADFGVDIAATAQDPASTLVCINSLAGAIGAFDVI